MQCAALGANTSGRGWRPRQPRGRELQRRSDHPVAQCRCYHVHETGSAGCLGDLFGRHSCVSAHTEHPQLGDASHELDRIARQALGSDVRDAQHAAGPKYAVALLEERLSRPEVKRGLHADNPIGRARGEGQVGCVAGNRCSTCGRKPIPARRQLPLGNVDRDQPTRVKQLREHRVLSPEPVADINDHTAGWQLRGRRFHQPAAGLLGLVLRPWTVPQPEIQPARCDSQEAIRSDALVDPRDRIPALLEQLADVPNMLAGPSGHLTTLHRMYAYSCVQAAE